MRLDARVQSDERQFASTLVSFFADRLKVQLREQGARHDLVDAVFALEGQDDLVLIVRRVEALAQFLDTEDGKNLLAGYKRATNIIRIEEKRDKTEYTGEPSDALYRQAEEWELVHAIERAASEASAAVAAEDFAGAMRAMAKLRPHVDAFFERVTVNADEPDVRANRLRLAQPDQDRDSRRRRFLQDRGVGLSAAYSSGRSLSRPSTPCLRSLTKKDVDGRNRSGHDEPRTSPPALDNAVRAWNFSTGAPFPSVPSGGFIHDHGCAHSADCRLDRRHPDSAGAAALNYIVAIYLIIVGITGLGLIH